MKTVIGIDVGGSTTKIVGFRRDEMGQRVLVEPQFVRATDPVTSIYGAFGKFTMQNSLELDDISRIMMTGAGSSVVTKPIYNLNCVPVPEFTSVGLGGLYLSGLEEAIVVSMGTGTALIHAARRNEKYKIDYLGGTGVGGGTLMGLSRLLLQAEEIDHICDMASSGNLANIDLRISDMTKSGTLDELARDLTAANFGNISDLATREDIASGLLNMVLETVGMISIFGARSSGVKDIVLTGNLTELDYCKKKFASFVGLNEKEGLKFIIPPSARFATVIGTALCG